jgi:hypothetical protein
VAAAQADTPNLLRNFRWLVDDAGDSTRVKPGLVVLWHEVAMSSSRARCSQSVAPRFRKGTRWGSKG